MPRGFKIKNIENICNESPTALLEKTILASFPCFLLDVFYAHTDTDVHLCIRMNTFLSCCFFVFFLKANKDLFDAVLCSPMVILGSSLLRHTELPCFFHSSTLCLYQNGCVISFLWRNTEVVSPLSCFLFHFYGMNGNKVEPWSPHTREFPISTSIPGPLFAS